MEAHQVLGAITLLDYFTARFTGVGPATNRQGVWTVNPTVFAMRRPVTTLMLVVALISGGGLAYNKMRVDIFPR